MLIAGTFEAREELAVFVRYRYRQNVLVVNP